jgi:hypothetical protein
MSGFTSLEQKARLELEAANSELANAHDALQSFIRANCFLVDGTPVLAGPPARREKLESELRELKLSFESAARKVEAAQERVSLCAEASC